VVNKNASKSDYKKSKPNYLVGNHVIEWFVFEDLCSSVFNGLP
jgi:hypothetical protein